MARINKSGNTIKPMLFLILTCISQVVALAQRPFVGLYAGAATSIASRYWQYDYNMAPAWAGRAEAGVTWLQKIDVGIQLNVQPWRFRQEVILNDFNGRPTSAINVELHRAAPALTTLAFARYTAGQGVRIGVGFGYCEAIGKAGIRSEDLWRDQYTLANVPSYYHDADARGVAGSLQLGYKYDLPSRLSIGADVAFTYARMHGRRAPSVWPFDYSNFCITATAGLQYSF